MTNKSVKEKNRWKRKDDGIRPLFILLNYLLSLPSSAWQNSAFDYNAIDNCFCANILLTVLKEIHVPG